MDLQEEELIMDPVLEIMKKHYQILMSSDESLEQECDYDPMWDVLEEINSCLLHYREIYISDNDSENYYRIDNRNNIFDFYDGYCMEDAA